DALELDDPLENVLPTKDGKVVNDKDHPLIVKVAESAPAPTDHKRENSGSSTSSNSSGKSEQRKARIAALQKIAEELLEVKSVANNNKKMKRDSVPFSDWGKAHKQVKDAYGISEYGPDVFIPPSLQLPDRLLDTIWEEVQNRFRVLGSISAGPEKKKEKFIDTILFRTAGMDYAFTNVRILIEKSFCGIDVPAHGQVEYAIQVGDKFGVVLEAKADKVEEGKVQNYVECEVILELKEEKQASVFGIVTNGEQWFFHLVSSNNLKEHHGNISWFLEKPERVRDDIRLIAECSRGL
ncbi:hypothetical protein HK102_001642, partial [Quaeritorhiza haematococci]